MKGEDVAMHGEVGGKLAVSAAMEQLAGAEEDQHYEHHVQHANPVRR